MHKSGSSFFSDAILAGTLNQSPEKIIVPPPSTPSSSSSLSLSLFPFSAPLSLPEHLFLSLEYTPENHHTTTVSHYQSSPPPVRRLHHHQQQQRRAAACVFPFRFLFRESTKTHTLTNTTHIRYNFIFSCFSSWLFDIHTLALFLPGLHEHVHTQILFFSPSCSRFSLSILFSCFCFCFSWSSRTPEHKNTVVFFLLSNLLLDSRHTQHSHEHTSTRFSSSDHLHLRPSLSQSFVFIFWNLRASMNTHTNISLFRLLLLSLIL